MGCITTLMITNGVCSQFRVSCGEGKVDFLNQYRSFRGMISQHIATCLQPRLCNAGKSWSTSGLAKFKLSQTRCGGRSTRPVLI